MDCPRMSSMCKYYRFIRLLELIHLLLTDQYLIVCVLNSYFGHSGGEQYIKSSQIRQLGNCAVSLLLGCSSGSLKGAGEFDPTGNAVNYLLAGCPTLVANLWDVTDRDLDRFSKAMFSLWGLDQNCRGTGMRQHQEQQ